MKKLVNYLRGVREEFAKVVFPERRTVIAHTTMVIASIVISIVIIAVIDFGLSQVVKIVFVER